MEDNTKKEFDIVLLDGEYMETYTYSPDDEPDLNRKVKKGMLRRIGLTEDEIEKVVDSVDLEFDQGGADGEFDDMPYTPCRLVKKVAFEPFIKPTPSPVDEVYEEKEKGVSQLMLEQYYGDATKERERNAAFKRYKSYIGKKTIDVFDEQTGDKKTIEVYGVLDYIGKAQDTKDLRITGFETRLEKLSRAIQGDFSLYEIQLSRMASYARQEMLDVYETLRETDPELAEKIKGEVEEQLEDLSSEENKHRMIQALIDKDTEFIETNNYSYNSHQHVQAQFKTLGKHGEKSIKHAITEEHSTFNKVKLSVMNAMISLRNTVKAPIHKAVGTYVAAPIHKFLFRVGKVDSKEPVSVNGFKITPIEDMLETSQKRSAGAFKNKPTHRYQARKAYFIQQEREALAATGDGSLTTKKNIFSNIYHFAVVPRINAIFNWREGNVAVLNAGAHDEIELSQKRLAAISSMEVRLRGAHRKIELYEKDIESIQILLKSSKTPEQKVMLEQTLASRKKGLLREEVRRNELERMEIDDVPVDAIGLSDHDKAVKSDMTKAVTGLKLAGRVATGYLVSRYIYKEVPGKDQIVEEEIFHPASQGPDQIVVRPGMNEESIGSISFDDLSSGATRTLSHNTYSPNAGTIDTVAEEFRGLAFNFNGKKFSGADISAMSANPNYAGCIINQPLDGSTSVSSVIKEILEDSTGKAFTDAEITGLISSGEISGIQRCLSRVKEGIPSGWEAPSDALQKIISSGTHEIVVPGEVIPAYIETVYKVVSGSAERVINAPAALAMAALGAGQFSDLNDLMRYTESEPGKIRMMIEYEKSRIEREEAKRKRTAEKGEPEKRTPATYEKIPLHIETRAFQRNTKPKTRRFTCQPNIPGFEGFHGTKRKDLGRHGKVGQTGYNENEIVGFADEPPEFDEFESKRAKKQAGDDLEI